MEAWREMGGADEPDAYREEVEDTCNSCCYLGAMFWRVRLCGVRVWSGICMGGCLPALGTRISYLVCPTLYTVQPQVYQGQRYSTF